MQLEFLGAYWWAVLALMLAVFVGFVLLAGRGAEGGMHARARLGWAKWRELSRRAGELQARIILTIFYFTLVAPFGLLRGFLSDPLRLRPASQGRAWLPRRTRDLSLEDARRQF